MRRDSTACECGYRRLYPGGPCVNAACKHYRTSLTAREWAALLALMFAPVLLLLVVLAIFRG